MVLFCGSGSTAVIATLIRVLELSPRERPVVFVAPYDHHSNELPWRESVADVVTIREDAQGGLDIDHLDRELRRNADRPLKIGSFSAASNVTGIITDVEGTATVLRRHGALSCWDYATAGPYLPIDMADKDAVFLSPHKFVGGTGTPGVLVAKRALLRNRVPSVPGGGTILCVSPGGHSYHPDPVIREEGGTPAIVESIRAGLVFALKEKVGVDEIIRREQDFARRAPVSWSANPNIEILGNTRVERRPIVSFGRRHPPRLLHSNFVVRCSASCSGSNHAMVASAPDHTSTGRTRSTTTGRRASTTNPRWATCAPSAPSRVSASTTSSARRSFSTSSRRSICSPATPGSCWRCTSSIPPAAHGRPTPSLADAAVPRVTCDPEHALARHLDEARQIVRAIEASWPRASMPDLVVSPEFERFRWFAIPGEAHARLHANPPDIRVVET